MHKKWSIVHIFIRKSKLPDYHWVNSYADGPHNRSDEARVFPPCQHVLTHDSCFLLSPLYGVGLTPHKSLVQIAVHAPMMPSPVIRPTSCQCRDWLGRL